MQNLYTKVPNITWSLDTPAIPKVSSIQSFVALPILLRRYVVFIHKNWLLDNWEFL